MNSSSEHPDNRTFTIRFSRTIQLQRRQPSSQSSCDSRQREEIILRENTAPLLNRNRMIGLLEEALAISATCCEVIIVNPIEENGSSTAAATD